MVTHRRWFDRRFELGLPVQAFPGILERLRGTPARLEDRLHGLPAATLTRCLEGTWSIQENAGHLLDLEPLWEGRLDELLLGVHTLRPADLQNRKTHDAAHNARPIDPILSNFRSERMRLVGRLQTLD